MGNVIAVDSRPSFSFLLFPSNLYFSQLSHPRSYTPFPFSHSRHKTRQNDLVLGRPRATTGIDLLVLVSLVPLVRPVVSSTRRTAPTQSLVALPVPSLHYEGVDSLQVYRGSTLKNPYQRNQAKG